MTRGGENHNPKYTERANVAQLRKMQRQITRIANASRSSSETRAAAGANATALEWAIAEIRKHRPDLQEGAS